MAIGDPDGSIYRFLDTNGDGTGGKSANGDYSVTPEEFSFKASKRSRINRMIIHIEDTTGAASSDYGNIAGGLSNGYSVVVKDEAGTTIKDLTDGIPIKTNMGLGRYCYDVDLKTWAAGDEAVQVRWTFAKAGLALKLYPNYSLSITFNDDLTGLVDHTFMVQGYEYQE